MKKVFITSSGCTNNKMNSSVMKKNLENSGWELVDYCEESDLIIYFSCGATKSTEDRSILELNKLLSIKKNNTKVIITGCLEKINKEIIREKLKDKDYDLIPSESLYEYLKVKKSIEYVTSFTNKDFLVDTKNSNRENDITQENDLFSIWNKNGFNHSSDYTYLKICSGCLGNCSYCAIRFSQGKLKSRKIDEIVHEVRQIDVNKIKHLMLMGSDCGSYGQDIGTNIIELMNKILNLGGNFKVSFLYISPQWIIKYYDDFTKIFDTGRILYMNTPIQSGSDKIIANMKRKYKIEDVKRYFKKLNDDYPKVLLGTGVILGFPGETEEDFDQTIELLKHIRFNTITYHIYSDRPSTEASKMEHKITLDEIRKRESLLIEKVSSKEGLAKLLSNG